MLSFSVNQSSVLSLGVCKCQHSEIPSPLLFVLFFWNLGSPESHVFRGISDLSQGWPGEWNGFSLDGHCVVPKVHLGLRTLSQAGSQACSLWFLQSLTIHNERVLPSGYSQAMSSRACSSKPPNTTLLSTVQGGIFFSLRSRQASTWPVLLTTGVYWTFNQYKQTSKSWAHQTWGESSPKPWNETLSSAYGKGSWRSERSNHLSEITQLASHSRYPCHSQPWSSPSYDSPLV